MVRTWKKMQLEIELAEIKHKHKLEIDEAKADFVRAQTQWKEDKDRLIKQLKEDSEIKLKEVVTLTRLDSEQRIKQSQLDADRKVNAKMEELNKAYYDKLSDSMSRLHEEGNVTTRFVQELSLKMLGSLPTNKTETKVLTGSIDVKAD